MTIVKVELFEHIKTPVSILMCYPIIFLNYYHQIGLINDINHKLKAYVHFNPIVFIPIV